MICELQIKLSDKISSILKDSNHFIYEIERICASHDRHKLLRVYIQYLVYRTKHGLTHDSQLLLGTTDQIDNEQLQEITKLLPFLQQLLESKSSEFNPLFAQLKQGSSKHFSEFFKEE